MYKLNSGYSVNSKPVLFSTKAINSSNCSFIAGLAVSSSTPNSSTIISSSTFIVVVVEVVSTTLVSVVEVVSTISDWGLDPVVQLVIKKMVNK